MQAGTCTPMVKRAQVVILVCVQSFVVKRLASVASTTCIPPFCKGRAGWGRANHAQSKVRHENRKLYLPSPLLAPSPCPLPPGARVLYGYVHTNKPRGSHEGLGLFNPALFGPTPTRIVQADAPGFEPASRNQPEDHAPRPAQGPPQGSAPPTRSSPRRRL